MHPTVVVARRALVVALALFLVVALMGMVGHATPARADLSPDEAPSVVASITQTSSGSPSVTYSTRSARVISNTLYGGLRIAWGDRPSSSLDFESDAQRPLHTGGYTDVQPAADTGELSFDAYGDRDFEPFHGEFEVLDLATDANGNFTRLHIVFITSTIDHTNTAFGEVRLNEPEPSTALSASALSLRWPTTPRSAARIYAVETVTNTTGSTLKLGTAKVVNGATDDFRLRRDRCSRHSLAGGASCTVEVGFSASRGGPRTAVLDVPGGKSHLVVSLAGSGRIGTTKITISGSAVRDKKKTVWTSIFIYPRYGHDDPEASYRWEAGSDTQGRPHHINLRVSGPLPLTEGKHSTRAGAAYELNTLFDSHCGSEDDDQEGTINIRRFRADATNVPVAAKIDFDESCGSARYHGQLLWQDRADTTAPSKPSRLRIDGGKARWKNSSSHDYASTIVRVLPDGGENGLPLDGFAVSSGHGSSAALPSLTPGRRYTLLAWTLDETGNVSSPTSLSFGG